MTRTQLEKRIEKLRGIIDTKLDKRLQLAAELDQRRAELKTAKAELKALPKPARKAKVAAGDSEE